MLHKYLIQKQVIKNKSKNMENQIIFIINYFCKQAKILYVYNVKISNILSGININLNDNINLVQPNIYKWENLYFNQSNIITKFKKLLSSIVYKKKTKKKKRRFNISNFGTKWRQVKRFIKMSKKKQKKKQFFKIKKLRNIAYNAYYSFIIKVKYKPSYRVYKWKRKKFFFLKIINKKQKVWSTKTRKNTVAVSLKPLKHNYTSLRRKLTLNYFLLRFYKKKKSKKIFNRRKKHYLLFNRALKNNLISLKSYKYNKFFKKYCYTPILARNGDYFIELINYKTYFNIIKTPTIKLFNFNGFLIQQNKPRTPSKWTPTIAKKKNPVNKYISIKKSIFSALFSFYASSMIINNLTLIRNINKVSLLKIKSQQLLDYRKVTRNSLTTVVKIESRANKQNNKHSNFINLNILSKPKLNKSINNFFPLTYFLSNFDSKKGTVGHNRWIRQLYYSQIKTLEFRKYKNFYNFFLLNFLEQYLKKKIWIRSDIRDIFSNTFKKYINLYLYFNARGHKRFIRLISVHELIEIIIIMCASRDLQIFLHFIKTCFERSHFKKHKKILSILFDTFRKNKILLNYMGIKGFFFDIRGKVGVSGNAKKRHLFFSLGKITTTSQNIRSYWQQINVWTPTGQMGITCCILY